MATELNPSPASTGKNQVQRAEERSPESDARPALLADRSFWGMTATQFLGAFNDNLYKQLMLLLAIRVQGNGKADDNQGIAMIVFCIPFLLFSGIAGFLSERISKRTIVVAAKAAEIGITLLGLAAFLSGSWRHCSRCCS